MPNTFFTSDNHYFHKNIIAACNRPFANVDGMNTKMIENWNSVVDKTDTVYCLGDFSFGNFKDTLDVFHKLNGAQKFLIRGNHDGSNVTRLPWTHQYDQTEVKFGDYRFWLNHYPKKSWNKSYHGAFHLHGHIHGQGEYWADGLSCDVGVDMWDYRPVSADKLVEWFNMLKPLQEANGHFMWKGKPFEDLQVVYYEQINRMAKKI